jgi:hypothetical protein
MEEAGENHRPWENNWSTLSLAAAMKEINYMLYISFIIQNTREEKGSRESLTAD